MSDLRQPGMFRLSSGDWECVPVAIGPTWDRDPDWDGPRAPGGYILPHCTLGWQVILWIQANLLNDEGEPFKLTNEQKRFILWWYAVDGGDPFREPTGRFLHPSGVLQRLKGWGKDPLAAVLAAVEFVGPCRFAGWATEDHPELGIGRGDPVAKPHPRAWVQLGAVAKDQNKNTTTLFPGLFTKACIREHGITIGKEILYAHGGARRIEIISSASRSIEGNRPTFVVKNETHHWISSNGGHDVDATLERNMAKSKGGNARMLAITNAYEPGEDSIAERERNGYEAVLAGEAPDMGFLYDSLEAPPDARLYPPKASKDGPDPSPDEAIQYVTSVLKACQGDAVWLNIQATLAQIFNPKNPASQSRRFYYNVIVAAEDAWLEPEAVKLSIHPLAREARRHAPDPLRVGWDLVLPDDDIVMFFDGSKSEDSTALVGCRLEDLYTFVIGVWQKPRPRIDGAGNKVDPNWLAPRPEVDARVREAFARFKIRGFWADPSHAKDDDDATQYWRPLIDSWHRDFKHKLEAWPRKSGVDTHSVLFDMSNPQNLSKFVPAAMQFVADLQHLNDVEEIEPTFFHDGHPALMDHLMNAKDNHTSGFGTSLMKENRSSAKKIDLAVSAVGAHLLARAVLNAEPETDEFPEGAPVWYPGKRRRAGIR